MFNLMGYVVAPGYIMTGAHRELYRRPAFIVAANFCPPRPPKSPGRLLVVGKFDVGCFPTQQERTFNTSRWLDPRAVARSNSRSRLSKVCLNPLKTAMRNADPFADHDPEADGPAQSGSGTEASEDEGAGTEHYATVGKSKLRGKESLSFGPEYRGSKVSRAALDEDSEDDLEDDEEDDGEYADPDLVDLAADEAAANDSEIDSDNALAESDADRLGGFTFRGSSKPTKSRVKRALAADFLSATSDEEDAAGGSDVNVDEDEDDDLAMANGAESAMSDEDEEMDDGLDDLVNGGASSDEDDGLEEEDDDEEDSESDSDDEGPKKKATAGPKMGSLAVNSNPDIRKGLAIQQQRKVYDGLLNLRIRLQKALVAANTFPALEDAPTPEAEPYEAAEEAAIKLLNTISTMKGALGPGRAGGKRKRDFEVSTPSGQIWEQISADDKKVSKVRNANLEKWSQKVRTVNDSSSKKSLVSSLEQQFDETEHRLVKRSKTPRSCAPAQIAKRVGEDEHIYDDADFYQQLLKELVDQRTVDGSAEQASNVPSVMLTASRDAKARKYVDRKASKGRKMRFTVHEKLQNFMAAEDRRSWEQGAIDRFFGTLFGKKMELDEVESEDDMEGLSANAEGLRLFR